MSEIEFSILLRSPKYPVLIFNSEGAYSAFSKKKLALKLIESRPRETDKGKVISIDASGMEFWYSMENYAITPAFTLKKWTKMNIVNEYNSSSNVIKNKLYFNSKSLSNKRLDVIIRELCELVRKA